MTITVGYPQTNRKTDTGKTLKPWPVLVDHYTWQEFDENGRMKPSSWYDRIVDVAEELFKITLLLKGQTSYLADRYSERKESHQELSSRVNQDKI